MVRKRRKLSQSSHPDRIEFDDLINSSDSDGSVGLGDGFEAALELTNDPREVQSRRRGQ
jgi:hypothetical protein